MAQTLVLPLADYSTGLRNIPEFSIADNITSISLKLQRCTTANPTVWPNVTTGVSVSLEISVDGRLTWIPAGAFIAPSGGIFHNKDGSEEPVSDGIWSNIITGTGRFIRGTINIVNGPLRTSGTVEFL